VNFCIDLSWVEVVLKAFYWLFMIAVVGGGYFYIMGIDPLGRYRNSEEVDSSR